jgi:hypothetical protein
VTRRRTESALLAVLLVALGVLAAHEWTRPRIRTTGPVALLVDGHSNPLRGHPEAGIGLGGHLGLVGGRCVGFPDAGAVVVWPAGTRLERHGSRVRVTSGGRTVQVGDQVSGGGSEGVAHPRWWRARLPAACRDARLISFGLE